MVTKRKAAPKRPAPDPRYVLGQLYYLDGAGYARCRVCFWGDGPPNTGMHSPTCVIGQAIQQLEAVIASPSPMGADDIGHVAQALVLLGVDVVAKPSPR